MSAYWRDAHFSSRPIADLEPSGDIASYRNMTRSGCALLFAGMLLAGCEGPKPTSLERAIWATDIDDPKPRTPAVLATVGTPEWPDNKRMAAKGAQVLRVIPPGTPRSVAISQLKELGFTIWNDSAQWLQVEKDLNQPFRECHTAIDIELAHGQVKTAMASDYQATPFDIPGLQSTPRGPARCR